jgi:hypothetical protein
VSRKQYNEAAQILRETAMPAETRAQLVARFVTMFADDNARFSPSRFRAACEPTALDALERCREAGAKTSAQLELEEV